MKRKSGPKTERKQTTQTDPWDPHPPPPSPGIYPHQGTAPVTPAAAGFSTPNAAALAASHLTGPASVIPYCSTCLGFVKAPVAPAGGGRLFGCFGPGLKSKGICLIALTT